MKEYGQIDVLVNNVGGTNPRRDTNIETLDMDYFDEAFHLNLSCTMYLSQLVIPIMSAQGGGNIVNVASISGITADSNGTLYGASKAGVINLTKYIATQTGKNIRCNAVAPGLILTPAALNNLNEEVRKIFLGQCATPYLGEPQDVAATIAFSLRRCTLHYRTDHSSRWRIDDTQSDNKLSIKESYQVTEVISKSRIAYKSR